MIPYKTKAEIMVDSECKRYFNFDGVMAGVLYLIHKYMPDHFQSRCYETFYEEWKLRCHDDDFVKDLNVELNSASNHMLKVDKMIDVEMKGVYGHAQKAILEIEFQNRYQATYWQRACNYLCRIRSEYIKVLKDTYFNQWIPIVSCWFMTHRPSEHYPFVKCHTFCYDEDDKKHLMLAMISFQFSKNPPDTDDEIELAFYQLLSPYSNIEERSKACSVLHCEISQEEANDMCDYSGVCRMLGREDGLVEGLKEGLKEGKIKGKQEERMRLVSILLQSMSVEEVYIALKDEVSKEEIMQVYQANL